MIFEWDEEKNKKNILKHKISFEEAGLIFNDLTLTIIDSRKDYGEVREISIGQLSERLIVTVVHTDRNGVTRLISARLANKAERKNYNDYCKKISQ
ncbi:MAG: BrnT family toxin [Methylomarinum sp.]|nr:BrnT family toxin [Methylomarinum sp.]